MPQTDKPINYHLVSDTHFNHLKLEEWGGRSGDWQDQLWHGIGKLTEDDVLIHLGDICIGDDAAVHQTLRTITQAQLILVRGNHDKKSHNWYTQNGWDFVCDGLDLNYRGHYLHLSHRPQRERDNITHNIHGHTHGNMHRSEEYLAFYHKGYHVDISPELVGYKPVRLDQLLAKKTK